MTADERRAHNEALFRDLNERVKEIGERMEPHEMGSDRVELEFLCECGDLDCARRFPMRREEYEAVRKHPTYFIVIPEHVNESIEHVIKTGSSYVVVEKEGELADIAEETDPRE